MPALHALPPNDLALHELSGRPRPLVVQMLGPLRIWRDGQEIDAGPRQQRCLLTLLLARVGQPVGTSEMIDLLWPDAPPASAVNIIQKYIGALRRLVEPQRTTRGSSRWLVRHGNGYRFVAEPEALDLANFHLLVDRAREALRDGDATGALTRYQEAVGLWAGTVGDSLAESAAAVAMFSAVDQKLVETAMEAADLALRLAQPGRFVALQRRIAAWHPLNEPLHARLVLLLAAAGRPAEAMDVHEAMCRRLAEDLGLDPGPELRLAGQRVLAVPPAQLPPALPTFVGRQRETDLVARLYDQRRRHPRSGPLVVVLSGLAGVGKSTLAVHLAHTLAPDCEDGQLFVHLGGSGVDGAGPSVRETLVVLLQSLGVPAGAIPGETDALIGMYRSLTAGKNLLLLLDNARNLEQVRALIPNSSRGLVLVTSRASLAGLEVLEDAHLVRVDLPSTETAREIITRRLCGSGQKPDLEAIDEIVELCGRLPLALALTAARAMARPRFALQETVTSLRDSSTVLATFPQDGGHNDPRSIYSWCYHQLSDNAARLFRLLSTSVSPTVSARACASLLGAGPATVAPLLLELTESALVSEVAPGRYSCHVLVRAFAEELLLTTDPRSLTIHWADVT